MNNTLGQITDEIMKAVKAYHVASMGDDSREIAFAASEYQRMIREHGLKAVDTAVRYYNENVIGKAK
jgi:diketogulonate reductase-like aldo/keto reductase